MDLRRGKAESWYTWMNTDFRNSRSLCKEEKHLASFPCRNMQCCQSVLHKKNKTKAFNQPPVPGRPDLLQHQSGWMSLKPSTELHCVSCRSALQLLEPTQCSGTQPNPQMLPPLLRRNLVMLIWPVPVVFTARGFSGETDCASQRAIQRHRKLHSALKSLSTSPHLIFR